MSGREKEVVKTYDVVNFHGKETTRLVKKMNMPRIFFPSPPPRKQEARVE